MSRANNPALKSWVDVPEGSDFPIQNLPFGIFSREEGEYHVGVAIGEEVLDLSELKSSTNLLDEVPLEEEDFFDGNLNAIIGAGRGVLRQLRETVSDLLASDNKSLAGHPEIRESVLFRQSEVEMHLPIHVGDYTDFYSSIEHATNVGTMFRDPNNALLPNWKHIPVGYHGRASSIVVSGTDIHRPKGQMKPNDQDPPVYGPCRLLDFELEMAFVVGEGNDLGHPIPVDQAEHHIAGMFLFNDWSARDIQKWEYVPLGPFLGKNFASSLSPWMVTLDALEPFRVAGPVQDPAPLDYLSSDGNANFDIQLEVLIQPEGGEAHRVCASNFKYMYWSMRQQLAHHTVNGCNMQPGDLCASGTISGPVPESYGSMLELSWKGTKPIAMPDGSERKFLLDGDTVIMKAFCEQDGRRIGFGEVRSKVLPAV